MPSGHSTAADEAIIAEVRELRAEVSRLRHDLTAVEQACPDETVHEVIERLQKIIDGDATSDIPGLRARVSAIEASTHALQREREAMTATLRGIVIGLGLTGTTSVMTFITVIAKTFGGG
jgi:hypothetical protein